MQSDFAIQEYFRKIFGDQRIVDGDVALNIPQLEALTARRDALLPKLEHAINVRVVAGREPTHKDKTFGGELVKSIPAYQKELEELNQEISFAIDNIVGNKESRRTGETQDVEAGSDCAGAETGSAGVGVARDGAETVATRDAATLVPLLGKEVEGLALSLRTLVVSEEGSARSAAVVTFADLVAANTALQVVHHSEPWEMKG